ncbi:MAG: TRAP transporter fused permease subunit [Acidilobaceae archaeon]
MEYISKGARLARILLLILGFVFILFELVYIMKFNFLIYSILKKMGLEIHLILWTPDVQQTMAMLLSIIVIATILIKPSKFAGKLSLIYDFLIITSGVAGFGYIFIVFEEIARYGYVTLTPIRVLMPLLAIIALLDVSRRVVGLVLPSIALGALLFAWYHEGFNIRLIVNHFYYAKEGIFSIPLFVMVSYVFAFILFGSFLVNLGVGSYITEFLLALFGPRVKGIAKIAVISSLFAGTVSGSSVANVLVTGTYTIPLSKRAGYPPHIAGAVEASASTGGQIMPPILGAAAFVMAEFLGRPYRDIMIASVVPALLYFISVYVFIDRISKRLNVLYVSREYLPPLAPLAKRIYLLSPIPIITILLLWGLEPQYAALGSLGVVILLAWVSNPQMPLVSKVILSLLFIILTLIAIWAGFHVSVTLFFLGVSSVLALIALAILMRGVREVVSSVEKTFIDAMSTAPTVFSAAALAGIIQGSLTLTGLAASIGFKIIDLAGGNIFIIAFLVMLISLILGMGVPTTANYIITSTIGAPALALAISSSTGLPLDSAKLVAHFFVFYFGILADVTPPVALASYAASSLAKSDFWMTALTASKLSLAGYLVPYIIIMNPTLLLITLSWSLENIAFLILGVGGAIATILTLSSGIEGWLGGPIGYTERALLVILGLINIIQNPLWLSALILTLTLAIYTIVYTINVKGLFSHKSFKVF